jgi:hypothetical protein
MCASIYVSTTRACKVVLETIRPITHANPIEIPCLLKPRHDNSPLQLRGDRIVYSRFSIWKKTLVYTVPSPRKKPTLVRVTSLPDDSTPVVVDLRGGPIRPVANETKAYLVCRLVSHRHCCSLERRKLDAAGWKNKHGRTVPVSTRLQ